MTIKQAVLDFDAMGVSPCEIAQFLGLEVSRVNQLIRWNGYPWKGWRKPCESPTPALCPSGAMPLPTSPNRSANLCAAI